MKFLVFSIKRKETTVVGGGSREWREKESLRVAWPNERVVTLWGFSAQ